MFGGVDEADVWKKLEELNGLYDEALLAERVRYDTLIEQYRKSCTAAIQKYKTAAEKRETDCPVREIQNLGEQDGDE